MALQFFDPGLLRTPIELQACEVTPDGQGGSNETWQTIADIFAHIEPVGSASQIRARIDEQKISHRITLRYREDLELSQRFQRGTRSFLIRGFYDLDETKRYLICKCEELAK